MSETHKRRTEVPVVFSRLALFGLMAWVLMMSAVATSLAAYSYNSLLVAYYAAVLCFGCGAGAYRTATYQGSGELRLLAASLSTVMTLLALRGGLWFLDVFHGGLPSAPDGWLSFADRFLTSLVLTLLGTLGALLYVALDPKKDRKWLAQRVVLWSAGSARRDGAASAERAEIKREVAQVRESFEEGKEEIVQEIRNHREYDHSDSPPEDDNGGEELPPDYGS